jgi:hypothetical protein
MSSKLEPKPAPPSAGDARERFKYQIGINASTCCDRECMSDTPCAHIQINEIDAALDQFIIEHDTELIEALDEMAFETDNGSKIELFINWDEARKKIAAHIPTKL